MGGEAVDCLALFTMHPAQYRYDGDHGTLVLSSTVDAGGDRGGIRWMELRSDPGDGDDGWAVYQEGTFAPADNADRWMASVAMNDAGDIALGYSHASASEFPSVRYTCRQAGDPLGVMTAPETVCHQGTGAQVASFGRWGDYSQMSVDPSNNEDFWYTQEYYATTSSFNFKTRICEFECSGDVTPPGGIDLTTGGQCPGFVDYDATGLTPGERVTVLLGQGPGAATISLPGCPDLQLGMASPYKRIFKFSDGSGELHENVRIPRTGCDGDVVQIVDITTCELSPAVPLDN
jgi:hypothetical protein